jgi:hypothetical protein
MSEYQKIEYLIDKNGKIAERVIDGHGNNCLAATEVIEASLGPVTQRELLPEYFESDDPAIATSETQLEQHF